jgi:hypothetical protein
MLIKEGPGAGYTITVGDYDVVSIDDFVVDSIELAGTESYAGLLIKGKCKGKVVANQLIAESYMYGTEELNDISAEFDWFEYEYNSDYISEIIKNENELKRRIFDKYKNEKYYDTVDDVDIDEFLFPEIFDLITIDILDNSEIKNMLKYDIENDSSSMIYGGGYVHSTYNGQLVETDDSSFNNINLVCNLHIAPNEIYQWCAPIEYIDMAVTGENISTTYDIWDSGDNSDTIESYSSKEYSLEDIVDKAIKFANDNDIDIEDLYITETTWKEYFDGGIEDIFDEIVWRGTHY